MADPARKEAINVLLVTRFSGLEAELRRRSLPGIALQRTKTDADTARAMAEAEVVLGDPALVAPHVDRAPRLRWVQSTYAGVDVLLRTTRRRDYILTRIQGVFGPLMAEYILGHILARERGLVQLARQQEERQWAPIRYRRLSDLTLGILGVGDIGRVVADRAKAFGMTVWGLRSRNEPVPVVDRVFTPDRLTEFLAGPDYLVNILPSTPATVGLLSGDVLKVCRDSAVLINVGRGDVIDETSLVRAVREGWIGGALLDVFPEEPLPEGSPLWSLPGVTITPHVAAFSFPDATADIFETNLARYRAGEPLKHQVDWGKGY